MLFRSKENIELGDKNMRAVVTRVKDARVEIDGKIHSQINEGLMVLLGLSAIIMVKDIFGLFS